MSALFHVGHCGALEAPFAEAQPSVPYSGGVPQALPIGHWGHPGTGNFSGNCEARPVPTSGHEGHRGHWSETI